LQTRDKENRRHHHSFRLFVHDAEPSNTGLGN